MKRITTAVLAGATVATLAYASASVLTVDSKPLQAGSDTVTCDPDGVRVTWGLETDEPDYVKNVKVAGIAEACFDTGAKLFVNVNGERVGAAEITTDNYAFTLPATLADPENIDNVKIWIG